MQCEIFFPVLAIDEGGRKDRGGRSYMILSATQRKIALAVLAAFVLGVVLFGLVYGMKRTAPPNAGATLSTSAPPLSQALSSPVADETPSAPPVILANADRLTPADIEAFGALFKDFKTYDPPEPLSPTLKIATTGGLALTMGDFRGGWLVVNFWASWCAPCVEELPAFDRLARKLQGSRVQVVAVSLDSMLDSKGVEAFVREKALGETALYVDVSGGAQKSLGSQGLPVTLVVDPSGMIRWRVMGIGKWDDPAAERFLRLLAREG